MGAQFMNIPSRPFLASAFAFVFAFTGLVPAGAEENWPRFRGPLGTGHSTETALPEKWDASGVAWRVALPGRGQSSPVNWGRKLFLTSAEPDGKTRYVFAIDTEDGNLLWTRKIEAPHVEATHRMNSHATASCATDGEVVVAFFGPGGLHGWDLDGKPLWSRTDLGTFPGTWGVGASPVIDGDLVIQNCDAEGASYLIAVHRKTGETVWKRDRRESPKGGWSTPILIDVAEPARRELVLNGEFGVHAYDPATGEELWFCEAPTGRGEPVPDYAHGLLYVLCGKPGDTYVVKPGGSGDVTATHRLWRARRQGGRDLPSPVVVGDVLFTCSMSGIATCYDARDGAVLGESVRLDAPVSASPVVANGLVYLQAENGDVLVVRPSETLEVVSRNSCGATEGEIFRATPAPIGGEWFLRSDRALYRVSF